MATLPPSSDITSGTATEGQAKTWLSSVRTFIAQFLGTLGTQAEALGLLGVPLNSSVPKSGAYTVVEADRGKVIRCTGTWTLSITAASTLGDGFVFGVENEGVGTITIDPNLSEQIDGATTKTIAAGKLSIVFCDGSKFVTAGSISTGPGSGLDADTLDTHDSSYFATAAALSGYTPIDANLGVGSFAMCQIINTSINAGSTIAGSNLRFSGSGLIQGNVPAGTWRAMGTCGSSEVTVFQRIA